MKRVLFVEDNVILLELYRMMLGNDQDQWESSIASGGEEALQLLKESTFDVIVSDMRMPGMSGLELLETTRDLYPQTSRIIVSGLDDQEEIAASLKSTHQFLAKPFDAGRLKGLLARIKSLDSYLKDEKIKSLVGRMGSLPSFPSLYSKIMQAVDSPDSGMETIIELVTQDPSLTAKMLQVVNSAALGLPNRIQDPFEAVQRLGLETVRSLALSAHVFSAATGTRASSFDVTGLWTHLMRTGQRALTIMRCERAEQADIEAAGTAGMLHDIGKLLLAENLPSEFQQATALAASHNISLTEAELEIFGATHAGVAAYLLGLWGLPAPMVEAVAFHHTPQLSDLKAFSPLTAVHVANVLEQESTSAPASATPSCVDQNYLEALGLLDRMQVWREPLETRDAAAMEPATLCG